MNVTDAPLSPVKVLEIDRHADARGWFQEVWNRQRYLDAGLETQFVQENVSSSGAGVLRGLHYQAPKLQAKLVSVLHGAVFDAVVDVRAGSPTFGRWFGCELSLENRRQLWVPEGFAHGFLVLSESALVHYSCTAPYDPASDRAIAWNDPAVGIAWPNLPATVSEKDRSAPLLNDVPSNHLAEYAADGSDTG